MNTQHLDQVKSITRRLTLECLGTSFYLVPMLDIQYGDRVYLQVLYQAPCTKTGEVQTWSGRKWYLSEYMTDDEIIKTAYAAFEAAVKHEVMEGFKVDGIILFNPHVNYTALLEVSNQEIKREQP